MGSMAQTGLLLVPSDALGHTWALPGVLGAGQGLPSETGMHACMHGWVMDGWMDGLMAHSLMLELEPLP